VRTEVNLSSGLIRELKTGIIVAESAAAHHCLTTYANNPLIVMFEGSKEVQFSNVLSVIKYDEKKGFKDCELLHDALYVTSSERAILDMIEYDRYEGWIYDALLDYGNDYTLLIEKAVEYGLEEKLEHFINTL